MSKALKDDGWQTGTPEPDTLLYFHSYTSDRTYEGYFHDERGPGRGFWVEGKRITDVYCWRVVKSAKGERND